MEIRQLELFLAVIEQASVTKAAERMSLSPGAVSLQLRNLAQGLRTELFVRSGKRIVPTPAALRLAERARALIRQAHQIEREFENDPSTDTRPFYFACGATALIYRLRRPFRQLRKQFPHIAMHVMVAPTEEMVAGVIDRRFDLALVTLPFPTGDLGVAPLFTENWSSCALPPSVCVDGILAPSILPRWPPRHSFFTPSGATCAPSSTSFSSRSAFNQR